MALMRVLSSLKEYLPLLSVLTISSMLDGEYGIKDVCLSIPTVIGGNGIKGRIEAPLTDAEITSLKHSADCLKDVIKQLTF